MDGCHIVTVEDDAACRPLSSPRGGGQHQRAQLPVSDAVRRVGELDEPCAIEVASQRYVTGVRVDVSVDASVQVWSGKIDIPLHCSR
jgi:hypothetical protein